MPLDELIEMQRLDADCSPGDHVLKSDVSFAVSAATRQWTFTTPFVLHVFDHSIVISLNCLCNKT